jgi:uncharacterized protein YecT (DUF1311 family)
MRRGGVGLFRAFLYIFNMKALILVLALYYFPYNATGQESLADVYNNHKFPCDAESTTLAANLCSGIKAEFADSLLNKLYRKILNSIDKEIARHNKSIKIRPVNKNDSADLRFAVKQKDYYVRMKQSIINSQRQWLKIRELDSEVESILCEGGTGCTAMVNEAYIADTLERIRKLEYFNILD